MILIVTIVFVVLLLHDPLISAEESVSLDKFKLSDIGGISSDFKHLTQDVTPAKRASELVGDGIEPSENYKRPSAHSEPFDDIAKITTNEGKIQSINIAKLVIKGGKIKGHREREWERERESEIEPGRGRGSKWTPERDRERERGQGQQRYRHEQQRYRHEPHHRYRSFSI